MTIQELLAHKRIVIDAVHAGKCKYWRMGKRRGICTCGARELQREIDRMRDAARAEQSNDFYLRWVQDAPGSVRVTERWYKDGRYARQIGNGEFEFLPNPYGFCPIVELPWTGEFK